MAVFEKALLFLLFEVANCRVPAGGELLPPALFQLLNPLGNMT